MELSALRWRLARALGSVWRRAPVRGPGRVLQALIPGGETVVPYAGARLLVSRKNPPELEVLTWGSYEPEVEQVLRAALPAGATAVDIGANCGVLTLAMRAAVGPEGRVVAIDPSPEACARVRAQVALNGYANVEVVETALARAAGREEFRLAQVGIGALPAADAAFTVDQAVDVEVRTLDALDLAPRLLKIDTDGHEVAVLAGAQRTLAEHRPVIVFELFAEGLRRRGEEPATLFERLDAAGYEVFAPRLRARPAGPPIVGPFAPAASPRDGNLLALHRDEHVALRAALVTDHRSPRAGASSSSPSP